MISIPFQPHGPLTFLQLVGDLCLQPADPPEEAIRFPASSISRSRPGQVRSAWGKAAHHANRVCALKTSSAFA